MNQKENLINKLTERMLLNELTKSKRDIISNLEQMSDLVVEHLIYCYLWNDSNELNHWKGEIYKFINRLPRFKGTNKIIDLDTLKDWFLDTRLEDIEDGIDGYVKTACFDEKKDIPNYNKQSLINFMKDYFIWLCETLVKQSNVSKPEIYEKIDELLSIYK